MDEFYCCLNILFGPYESHGVIRHKPQRLHGVLMALTQKNYEIEVTPTDCINELEVIMKGRRIFRCDIRNLLFNMDFEDDIVAQRLVAAVDDATTRLFTNKNVAKFLEIKNRIYKPNKKAIPQSSLIDLVDLIKPKVSSIRNSETALSVTRIKNECVTLTDHKISF